ncbi:MAG: sigma-70 family RNA polymerase sigma factor [Chloroflexi bacterium]|nr:sigma-70 family RNA polymerase sigma factor [Chloroflexota bacterium]
MIAERTLGARSEVERQSSASGHIAGQVDEALIERARRMDEDAWRLIVDLHYERLCMFLQNRTGNSHVAEDLASQVFTEAVARIGSYQWRGLPFAAWLFRIARNLSADHHRKWAGREGALVDSAVEHEELQRLEREADRAQVRQALASLTDEQRQVLDLRFVADLSVAETAAMIDKTEGATKAIQHRALASMRRLLEQIDPQTWRRDYGNANR